MKALMAAASAAVVAVALPGLASAQAAPPLGLYANLGYANAHVSGQDFLPSQDLGAIAGRLGWRFNPWLGVEGELAAGVKSDDFSTTVNGVAVSGKTKLDHAEAIYGVGFLPVSPEWDVLARVGYGHSEGKVEDVTVAGVGGTVTGLSGSAKGDSWNYGLGAQWHWDGVNGVRGDYTREEFTNGANGHADVWSLAYSRRF